MSASTQTFRSAVPPRPVLGSREVGRFDLFCEAIRRIQAGDLAAAKEILLSFPTLSVSDQPEDLKSFLFLKALWKRVDSESLEHEGNLYLREFASRQIDLFNLMSTRMPMVSTAVRLSNDLLASMIAAHDEVTLVDVGIGTGQQIVKLVRQLTLSGCFPNRLRVVGIEPAAAALKQAQAAVLAERGMPFQLEFVPIVGCAETLKTEDWDQIRRSSEAIVVNEAFALHHVVSRSGEMLDRKDAVLCRIRALDPVGFVLAEPHSNHSSPDLLVRFRNAWHHYGLVFDVIDEQPITAVEKDAMKVHFFAREIEDVVGASEATRTERHELAESWLARLKRAGFHPMACDGLVSASDRYPVEAKCRGSSWLSLDYRGEPVVAIIAAGG